ncbi:hypothetical protein Vadar_022429 [Vaccinium darrowii]|uniref:Uncharacterized protein n=1 Tax=Vaccinium darrowii TaxID=229202 RepID=A0ACB7XT13_9ERIC|nr:hypothetical protein Vadar_022429 [Vaccinium darrowii]
MAVANECGGLPIAVVTVGRALNGKDEPSWRSALAQLRKSIGKNIRGVEENVFRVLELSDNYLESEEVKRCFLLCSLFPEDSDIEVEDIVRYVTGLELFGSIDSVGEARDRVHLYVDHLKKCFLLMDGNRYGCVKMHDVIRDVAISIASKEEHLFMVRCDAALNEWPENKRCGNYSVISMICTGMRSGLPDNLEFPRLQLLRIESDGFKITRLPGSLYQGMKELKVVALSSMSIKSLPTSLRCLTNLQTLSLSNCKLVDGDLSVIGELKNLEILSFTGSDMEELPREIGNLSRLKLLDLLKCSPTRIPYGVLSSLSKLEELYLGDSFSGWDDVEQGIQELTNGCTAELASLPNLVALNIYVPKNECWVWPRDVVTLGKLKAFAISLGTSYHIDFGPSTNTLVLQNPNISGSVEEMIFGLKMLLRVTNHLHLVKVRGLKNVLHDLDGDGFEHLMQLKVEHCLDLECLINTTDGQLPKEAFCTLKKLRMRCLPRLVHLCKGPFVQGSLRNLTYVEVDDCRIECYVFSHAIATNLVQLQELKVRDCSKLEVIVSKDEGEHEITSEEVYVEFPKLTLLDLSGLPKFTGFCKAINSTNLPQLKRLEVESIPKLNCLCPASRSDCDGNIEPLFNHKDLLSGIETLHVSTMDNLLEIWPGDLQAKLRNIKVVRCHKLSNILFSSRLTECMQDLERLVVDNCDSVEVVFDLCGINVGGKAEGPTAVALPCLADLELYNLQKLMHVWANYSPTIQGFQNLRFLTVHGCSSLRILLSTFIAKLLVNLQGLEIFACDAMEAILAWEQEDDDKETTNMTINIFPQLTSLRLWDLPLLTSFSPQACTFQGSFLKKVEIKNCPAMMTLPSAVQRMMDKQQEKRQKGKSKNLGDELHLPDEDQIDSSTTIDGDGLFPTSTCSSSRRERERTEEEEQIKKSTEEQIEEPGDDSIEISNNQVLELAGNAARDNKKTPIVLRHIQLATRNDEELNKLQVDVTIANGGVMPNIPNLLLPKKTGCSSKPSADED